MVDQEKVKGTGTTDGFPAARLGRGMASLAQDATAIAELQAKLMALDLKDGSKFIRNAAILAVVGGVLLFACLPIGMIGLAELLVALAGWARWIAYLATGALGLVVDLVLLGLCWLAVRRTFTSFRRSREELIQNVEWFKETLRGRPNGSSPNRQFAGSE